MDRRAFTASALALLAAGCGDDDSGPPPVVLNRGNAGEPGSLDPHFISGTWEANIVGDVLMGLTTEDPAARPIPGAAERWEVSEDGKTWTFHLRPHQWSDGKPVTADDFVFAWQRLVNPKTAAAYVYALYAVKNAQAIASGKMPPAALGVAAPDARTLVVELEHPAPYLPELALHQTWYPLPRHFVEAKGTKWARPENYVSNGPYRPLEWVTNDHITLVKNPRFYDAARVKIDRVNYFPTSDPAASLSRVRAGEIDTLDPFAATQYGWLKRNMPHALATGPYLAIGYIAINLHRPPFDDVRVREALNLAYDREALVDRILQLPEPPAYSIVPPNVANYPGGVTMPFRSWPRDRRIARARELMAAAGYGPDRHLQTRYSTSTNPDSRRIAAATQAMLKQVYVDVEIVTSDLATLFHKLDVQDFELSAATWIADFNDAMDFLGLFRSTSGKNYGRYNNPAVDALLARADNEKDAQARGALLAQAETQILAEYPWVPVRFLAVTDLVQPYVKGWITNIRDFNRTRWLRIEPHG